MVAVQQLRKMSQVQKYVLKRTGAPPLRITATKIAESGRSVQHTGKFDRWYELAIYQLKPPIRGNVYVLEIAYRTNIITTFSAVAEDEYYAEGFANADDLWKVLERYNPIKPVVGFPEGVDQWERKQKRLKDSVQNDFDDRVADLMLQAAQVDDDFADSVDAF